MNTSFSSDKTLVEQTLLGDTDAYEALVWRHQARVLSRAKWITKSDFMAEDAAQDAFVTAWIKLDCLKDREKFASWVCRIAENCAKEMLIRFREYLPLEYADFAETASAVARLKWRGKSSPASWRQGGRVNPIRSKVGGHQAVARRRPDEDRMSERRRFA